MGGLKDSRWAKPGPINTSLCSSSLPYPPPRSPSRSRTHRRGQSSRGRRRRRENSSDTSPYSSFVTEQGLTSTPGPTTITTPSSSVPPVAFAPGVPPSFVPPADPNPTLRRTSAISITALPPVIQRTAQELIRYSKIVRRLKWKLPYLADGYRIATSTATLPPLRAEAEIMFKLDFHEYYMLLERAIVHLLTVYDVKVLPRDGITSSTHARNHRYHANVLATLDREDNPLHNVLGKGEVRDLLGRAKDLRNKWKYVEEDESNGMSIHTHGLAASRHSAAGSKARFASQALTTYDMESMLQAIFGGFDTAYLMAKDHVVGLARSDTNEPVETDGMDWDGEGDEDEHWDFMVDAMDWEAV